MTDSKKLNASGNLQEKLRKKLLFVGNSLPILQTKSNRNNTSEFFKLDLSIEDPKNKNSSEEIQVNRYYQLDIDKSSGKSKISIYNHTKNEMSREIEDMDFLGLVYKLHR